MTKEEAIYNLKSLLTMCDFLDAYGDSICAEPYYESVDMAVEALEGKDTNVPSKDIVYRQDVEDMLQNALPSRGMWEIEGDVVKNTICETVADLMMDLEKLPSAQPEIIRCKNCKHGSPNGKYGCRVYHYRRYETHDMEPDDFCSRAERRVDG